MTNWQDFLYKDAAWQYVKRCQDIPKIIARLDPYMIDREFTYLGMNEEQWHQTRNDAFNKLTHNQQTKVILKELKK